MVLRNGNQNLAVFTLQNWLNAVAGEKLQADGVFGRLTEAALVRYQRRKGLVSDGLFKNADFQALRIDFYKSITGYNDFSHLARNTARCEADKLGNGVSFFNMRADAALLWHRFRTEVKSYGANLTSVGAIRHPQDAEGIGRSKTSLHFAGIAHDFALDSGGMNPEKDNFVLTLDSTERWQIFARCTNEKAQRFNEVKTLRILNPITYTQRNGTGKPIEGKFINITEIANKHGLYHVAPHRGWRTSKAITVLEWHHLDFRNTLIMQGFSTFEQEIRTVWSEDVLSRYPSIRGQKGVFGLSWFG